MKLSKFLIMSLLSGGLILSSCGTKGSDKDKITPNNPTDSGTPTDIDPPSDKEEWETITYSTFKNAFDNREAAPWNHLDGYYGDEMGSLEMFRIVEDLINGKWVVDETLTENGGSDITPNLILDDTTIETYGNPPEGYELTFERNGNEKYRYIVHASQGGRTVEINAILDKYFYCTDHVQKVDNRTVIECHVIWSTVENGGSQGGDNLM